MIAINGSFRRQRITGQQRYATEIADRLLDDFGAYELENRSESAGGAWLRSQSIGRRRGPDDSLLTLTSRGPIVAPRHVVAIHDLFVLEHPEWFGRKYAVTHAAVLRAQIASASSFVAVSHSTAGRLAAFLRRPRPILVAPNAPATVFSPDETPQDLDVLRTLGLQDRSFFLAVGSMDPRKNLATVIQAHRALPDELQRAVPLVLAGAAAPRVFAGEHPEDSAQVMNTGYVSDADLASLYRHARAVVFPTLDEGFGLPAVEALACGARLLTSDIEITREVADGLAHFLPAQDTNAWTAAMLAEIDAPSTSGVDAARLVREKYDWNESARAVAEFVS